MSSNDKLVRGGIASDSLPQPEVFAIFAYLVAHNIASESFNTIEFIRWLLDNELFGALAQLPVNFPYRRVLITRILNGLCSLHRSPSNTELNQVLERYPEEYFGLLQTADQRALSGRLGVQHLMMAVSAGHSSAIKLLLSHRVDAFGDGLDSPLRRAIEADNIAALKLLIQAVTDVNQLISWHPWRDPGPILTWAFLNRKFEAVRILVDAGAKMPMRACFDHVFRTDLGLEDSLTLHGIVKDALDQETVETASLLCIVAAAERGNKYLSDLSPVHGVFKVEKLEQALCVAVCSVRVGAVITLLSRGVDPEARRWRASYTGQKVMEPEEPQQDEIEFGSPLLLALLQFDRSAIEDDEEAERLAGIIYLLKSAGTQLDCDTWRRYLESIDDKTKEEGEPSAVSKVLATVGFDINIVGPAALECTIYEKFYKHDSILKCGILLDLGIPIDEYGPGGLNALQAAATVGALDLVLFLLDCGANANMAASKPGGQTALQAALQLGHRGMRDHHPIRPEYFMLVDCLLDAGADLTASSAQGCTVLEAAATPPDPGSTSHQEIEERQMLFQKLLRLGAPITQSNSTLLLNNLIESDMLESLELVLEAGANPDGSYTPTPDLEHLDIPQIWSVQEMHLDLMHPSLRGPPWSPIQFASRRLNFEAIRILCNRGASLNALPLAFCGRTALRAACAPASIRNSVLNREREAPDPKEQTAVVKYLLHHNANVNAPPAERYGRTALQAAVAPPNLDPNPDVIQLLLDREADINAPPAPEGGITALQGAAIRGDLTLVKFLVEKGADVNAPAAPIQGRTAVEGAAEGGQLEVLRFLLRHGTTVMPPDGFATAIKLAGDQNHWHIVDILTRLAQAVRQNSTQLPPFQVPVEETPWL